VGGLNKCEAHEDIKEQMQGIETRLRTLELDSIRLGERLEALCKELASLTSWVKGLIATMLTAMVSFFIWYVQQLGR